MRWLLLLLFGCVADVDDLNRARLVFDPAPQALGFERSDQSHTISVTNRGPIDGQIEVSLQGAGVAAFFVTTPKFIAAGETKTITVGLRGLITPARLVIDTNDKEQLRLVYPLVEEKRSPCQMQITPMVQQFFVGTQRSFRVTAVEGTECVVSSVTLDRDYFDMPEPALPHDLTRPLELSVGQVRSASSVGETRWLQVRTAEGVLAGALLHPEARAPPIPMSDCLSAPTFVRFNPTRAGETDRQVAIIRNSCQRVVALTSLPVVGPFDLDGPPDRVGANDEVELWVVHRGTGEAEEGTLTINHDDGSGPLSVRLDAPDSVGTAEIVPSWIDFGTAIYRNPQPPTNRSECHSRTRSVQIFNDGNDALVVQPVQVTGDDSAAFDVTELTVDGAAFDPAELFVVQPNTSAALSMRFFPLRLGDPFHQSQLLVHHDADGSPGSVTLIGRGGPDGPINEMFTQPDGATVDLLFVIDDSGSMWEEQEELSANVAQFVANAELENADFQLAAIVPNTRSIDAGTFRECPGHPRIITGDYATQTVRSQAIKCLLSPGTNTSNTLEAGLGAARLALEKAIDPLSDPLTNPNHGFLRPNARLAIVIVSDEDDQSTESLEALRDFFFSVKGDYDPDRVTVHAIAGPTVDYCAFSAPGYRYEWMTQQTGGMFFNICQPDWQPLLVDLGLSVFAPFYEWDLTQPAVPSSIQVRVEGVLMPNSPADGFTYRAETNTVELHGAAIPAPGATVTIDYVAECFPQ